MTNRNYNTTYSFQGSAAIDTQLSSRAHTAHNLTSKQLIQGGNKLSNPYVSCTDCRAIQAAQAGLMTSAQILATQLCLLGSCAVVFLMWALLH